jgi:uncharacterized protein (DUF885 family)
MASERARPRAPAFIDPPGCARHRPEATLDQAQLTWDIFEHQQAIARRKDPYRQLEYVFTQHGGPHMDMPNLLINSHRVRNEADMQAYITRLNAMGPSLEQALARARQAA